ncbi:MAG TPA: hypothetical protein VF720_11065, partial [Candidatus Eisenbacteria bacterium]
VEEVARFHGYDTLSEREWNASGLAAKRAPLESWITRIREAWVALGFSEMKNPVLSDPEMHRKAGIAEDEMTARGVHIVDPQSTEQSLMRLSLLPAALGAIARNQRHGRSEVRLFEIGATYRWAETGPLADEPLELLVVATGGDFGPDLTRLDPVMDELRFKGLVEAFLARLRIDTPEWRCYDATGLINGTSAIITSGNTRLGDVGTLSGDRTTAFGIDRPVYRAHFDVAALLASRREVVRFREVSRFPASRRDLAFLVDRTVDEGAVREAIRKLGGALLVEAVLFDRFEGKPLPEGKISLAYALRFRADDRTLSDEDVRRAAGEIAEGLAKSLGAELRDG